MAFESSQRITQLPPYLFADIDRKRIAAQQAGIDIINFGVGDPDQPTPDCIVDRMRRELSDTANHRYPDSAGHESFRRATAHWFAQRYGVQLDVDSQILTLIGSKEGLGHFPLACLNPGDRALIPSPSYPVYSAATLFAGGIPTTMPLRPSNGWHVDFDEIDESVAHSCKLMYINYPNNPTGATADLEFYRRAVEFALRNKLMIAQDAAYNELSYEEPAPSILQVDGAMEVAVEFHSLSKTFNMTGWRIGFAVGNSAALRALARIKANLDSGQFTAIQLAATEAINRFDPLQKEIIQRYRRRRDILVEGLNRLGLQAPSPRATFYVWAKVPDKYQSLSFASRLLEEAHVLVIPGVGFGEAGEGYVRFALTVSSSRIQEGLERIARVNL